MKISARILSRSAAAVQHFWADDTGEVMIEYGLIVGMISVAIIGTLMAIGTTLRDDFFGAIVLAFGGGE